jgi:cellobiose phosphorylase
VAVYKVEPYVVAADVYSVVPHAGRGGWSWYTGSAGWMYRLVIESLLGLTLQVDEDGARLLIRPCLPAGWTSYHVDYRFRETTYSIDIASAGDAAPSVTLTAEPASRRRKLHAGGTTAVHTSVRASTLTPAGRRLGASLLAQGSKWRHLGTLAPHVSLLTR